jgi:hypothetical protein
MTPTAADPATTMDTFQKRIDDLFDHCTQKSGTQKSGQLDADRLKLEMRKVLADNRVVIDNLVIQLRALIGTESTLTIPVADGCVAKVSFTAPLTRENLAAFCKIFQSIADNFFTPQSANAGKPLIVTDTSEERQQQEKQELVKP